ncbi:MAG TPA: YncE family protein [Pyrinomonadaceae bacterium]|nr:YncE family protein [Pyrinomonadaceae bacterium]
MNLGKRMTMSLFVLLKIGGIVLLLTATTFAQTADAKRASRCNAAPKDPISYVPLPGHPFSTISSKDGCWLFVSVTSSNPKSANGVAMLSRMDGQIILKKVFPIEAGPTGMVMTHDGKLLIVADDDYVVFLDVMRMTAGIGDPILGYISDGDFSGSVYVNVTADDRFLFVSDENTETITVINLEKARSEGFKDSAKVGKISVGTAPIALTFSPDDRWLYTTSQGAPKSFNWPIACKPEGQDPATAKPQYPEGAIIVVDVTRAKTDPASSVISKVPAGCSPVRMAISPTGERVFVTARNSNALMAFDATALRTDVAHARVGQVPVGTAPVGVAVANEGKLVFVSNSNRFSSNRTARQTLTVIDAANVGAGQAAILGSVPAGAFPREFGHSPDGQTLFVANYNSNELEVIDLKRLPLDRSAKPPARQ